MNQVIFQGLIELLVQWLSRRSKQKKAVLKLIEAADKNRALVDNTGRREWVLKQLMKEGLTESQSLALIIAGTKLWRKMQAKMQKRVAVEGGPRTVQNL